jgi:MYXO-CTERM domain-containing protein
MMLPPAWKTPALLALGLAVLVPERADACGGFFCNQSQNPDSLPVAQTGENVLFAMVPSGDRFQLEAHVQIAYTGPADRFSWVVPVDSMPELDVGSDTVFARLLAMTEPNLAVAWHTEGTCREIPPPSYPTGPFPSGSGSNGMGSGPVSDPSPPPRDPGVNVSFMGAVGPYDAAIIKSTDPNNSKPLLDWLAENRYYVTPQGSKLIADYVREEKFFVAIRLTNGVGVSQIAPLVMRFLGPGPCIPLRLTAIAALADLQINLWVLGEHRVVPQNFYEMQLDEAALDWLPGMGQGYDEVVKRAANEAGGNAFVTDYAGPAAIMKGQIFTGASAYDLDAIAAAVTPPDALDLIGQAPYPRDTRLMDILRVAIPEPALLKQMGLDERQFYNRLRDFWEQYRDQFAPFDAAKLAMALNAQFVAPLDKAQKLFDSFPTLTRLRTFISPEEMSVDPLFTMNASLPEVPLTRTANAFLVCGDQAFTRCEAPVRLELPGGSVVWMKAQQNQGTCYGGQTASGYQGAPVMDLPALDIGWRRDDHGPGVQRFNNQTDIQRTLTVRNAEVIAFAHRDGCGCSLGGRGEGGAAVVLVLAAVLGWRRRRATSN